MRSGRTRNADDPDGGRQDRAPRRSRYAEDRLLLALGAVVAVASVAAIVSAVVALRSCTGDCVRAAGAVRPAAGAGSGGPAASASPWAGTGGAGAASAGRTAGDPLTGTRVDAADLARRLARAARTQGSVAFTVQGEGPRPVSGRGVARYAAAPADVAVTLRVAGRRTATVTTADSILFAPPRPVAGREWIRMPRTGRTPLVAQWDEVLDGVAEAAEPWAADWTAARVTDAGPPPAADPAAHRYVVELAGEPGAALAPVVGVRGPARVTLVLSVGADGLPSSAVYRTEQAGVRSSVTVRYTGWGLPVRIPDVPSSEVVEAETTDT